MNSRVILFGFPQICCDFCDFPEFLEFLEIFQDLQTFILNFHVPSRGWAKIFGEPPG